ncbi:MAG: hypothetical protein KJO33_10700 [Gammaproteobacteria bacterium]|nr:hypothetical protein [Gammaproteobacteria bacterium]
MKKFLLFLLLLAVVIGTGVWYFTTFRMDSMIEKRVEQAGSASLGAPVEIGSVKTSIRDGSLRISDITVPNPAGYRNTNAFTLRGIEAAVDYANFDIKRVFINQPEIVIEEKGGRTNFDVMLERINRGEKVPVESGGDEPVITIRHFRLNESRAAFESESLDRYTDLEIDAVELHDLRGTPSELATLIAREVLKEITQEAATEMLKAQARQQYEKVEESVTDKLKDVFGGDEDSG